MCSVNKSLENQFYCLKMLGWKIGADTGGECLVFLQTFFKSDDLV